MSPPGPPGRPPLLVVVVKGYPRLSETFVAQELAGLERRGYRLLIASLRRPYDRLTHPVHATIRAPVLYLPEYLRAEPGRVLRAHLAVLRRAPGRYMAALGAWLRDLARDPTVNRVRRFGQAGVLAAELPDEARHLYVHFLHTPASVARYAARLLGLGVSLAGHAKDIWTTPEWELREKVREARFTVTCTRAGRDRLAALAPRSIVRLVYHGIDRGLFTPPEAAASARDGSSPEQAVRLLSVGRFQPKKGFDVLLEALSRMRRHSVLTIVGYGPLEASLRAQAERLGLGGRVVWTGPLDQPAVRAQYRASDLFVLAPRVAPDGDRDGLPNVLVEALSQGLPVVATRVAAVPEIVDDGVTGRLVPPEDPEALAAVLDALAGDPDTRRRLGQSGLEAVARGWDLERGLDALAALLDGVLDSDPPATAARGLAASMPGVVDR